MSWLILFIAGIFEMLWAIGLKYCQGFTKLWASLYTLATMALSIYLLSLAIKKMPISIAYPVWTGIGAVGTVLFAIFFFNEQASPLKIFFIFLIIAGIAGLRLIAK